MCIWSCSEESQLRISLNLDRGKTVWVLGFLFFFSLFCLFFFFFCVDKRLGFFIRTWVFFFLFLGERAGSACSILSETLPYNCTDLGFFFFFSWVNGLEARVPFCLKRCLTIVPYEIFNI